MSLGIMASGYMEAAGGGLPAALLSYSFSGSGSTVTDTSGNGRHGTLSGGAAQTSGELVIGSGSRLAYAADAGALPTNCSVTLKFKTASTVDECTLFSKMRVLDSSNFNLYVESAKLRCVVRGTSPLGPSIILEGAPLSVSTTYQAALTYDGTTTRLYLDGVEKATATSAGGSLDMSGTASWESGDHSLDSAVVPTALGTIIDDIRLFNVALTPTEVSYAASNPVT